MNYVLISLLLKNRSKQLDVHIISPTQECFLNQRTQDIIEDGDTILKPEVLGEILLTECCYLYYFFP